MKKILIPIIGLLVLIILTPIILGKMANSNIDKKIENFKKDGIKITEINSDIGYLNTKRVFEVTFDKDTKNKTWQVYHKLINQAKFLVSLSFKNLPITKANFDVKVEYIKAFNQNYLKGLQTHITSKDFKTFEYKIDDYNKILKLVGFNGLYKNSKYAVNDFKIKNLGVGDFLTSEDNIVHLVVKDLNLGLVDYYWKSKKWNVKYGNLIIKGDNTEENLSTHLSPQHLYTLNDKVLSDKLGVSINNQVIAVSYFDWNLKFKDFKENSLKNSKLDLALLWSETEYQKALVGGGEIKLQATFLSEIPQTLNDIELNATVRFDKDLFTRVTKDFDPAMVNKYFKNYTSQIEIKNGKIKINGNRI